MICTRLNVIMCDTGEPLEVNVIIHIWLNSRTRSPNGSRWESSDARLVLCVVFKLEWESMIVVGGLSTPTLLSVLSFIQFYPSPISNWFLNGGLAEDQVSQPVSVEDL